MPIRRISLWLFALIFIAPLAWGASYECLTNASGETVLTRFIAEQAIGVTKAQVVQNFLNDRLRGIFAEQQAADSEELDRKLLVATTLAKQNARDAINAGITAPTVQAIGNQTGTVGTPITPIPIVASDPYDETNLVIVGVNLPSGILVTYHPTTGAPQLSGTPTNPGPYNTSIRAYSFTDIFGSTAFTFTVVAP